MWYGIIYNPIHTAANTEKISNLKGVLKVVNGGGQYQIVIGTDVPQVYQEVVSSLKGEGFEPLVREGDRVKKGQLLLKFDIDVIKVHNLSVVTPVVVTNTDDLKAVNPISSGSVTEKDAIIRFEV